MKLSPEGISVGGLARLCCKFKAKLILTVIKQTQLLQLTALEKDNGDYDDGDAKITIVIKTKTCLERMTVQLAMVPQDKCCSQGSQATYINIALTT